MAEKPKVNTFQGSFREFARGVAHYPVFRNETLDAQQGLQKLREGLRHGTGGIIISTHFSEVDPVWIMNDATEKIGLRNIPILQPIASDRTYGGIILKLGEAAGVKIMPIVTPDAAERAEKRGEKLEKGQGLDEYFKKAAEVLDRGGLVSMPYTATRQPDLRLNERDDVTTKFIYEMTQAGVSNFNIHFAAPELPGVTDYSTRDVRKYNAFQKHIIHHGATYSIDEVLTMCRDNTEGISERRQKFNTVRNVGKLTYEELRKIVPSSYLPKE